MRDGAVPTEKLLVADGVWSFCWSWRCGVVETGAGGRCGVMRGYVYTKARGRIRQSKRRRRRGRKRMLFSDGVGRAPVLLGANGKAGHRAAVLSDGVRSVCSVSSVREEGGGCSRPLNEGRGRLVLPTISFRSRRWL